MAVDYGKTFKVRCHQSTRTEFQKISLQQQPWCCLRRLSCVGYVSKFSDSNIYMLHLFTKLTANVMLFIWFIIRLINFKGGNFPYCIQLKKFKGRFMKFPNILRGDILIKRDQNFLWYFMGEKATRGNLNKGGVKTLAETIEMFEHL